MRLIFATKLLIADYGHWIPAFAGMTRGMRQ